MWLLSKVKDNVQILDNLAADQPGKKASETMKCCWHGGLGEDISIRINGYARVITYKVKFTDNVPKPEFPMAMWEGKVS